MSWYCQEISGHSMGSATRWWNTLNIAAYKMVKAYGPFEMLEMQRSAAKCSEVLAKCW